MLEIDDDLFQKAEIRAAHESVRVRDVVENALRSALESTAMPLPIRHRVAFPILPCPAGFAPRALTNAEIAQLEITADLSKL